MKVIISDNVEEESNSPQEEIVENPVEPVVHRNRFTSDTLSNYEEPKKPIPKPEPIKQVVIPKKEQPTINKYIQHAKWISHSIENNVEWKNTECLHKTLYQMVSTKVECKKKRNFNFEEHSSETSSPNERKLPEPIPLRFESDTLSRIQEVSQISSLIASLEYSELARRRDMWLLHSDEEEDREDCVEKSYEEFRRLQDNELHDYVEEMREEDREEEERLKREREEEERENNKEEDVSSEESDHTAPISESSSTPQPPAPISIPQSPAPSFTPQPPAPSFTPQPPAPSFTNPTQPPAPSFTKPTQPPAPSFTPQPPAPSFTPQPPTPISTPQPPAPMPPNPSFPLSPTSSILSTSSVSLPVADLLSMYEEFFLLFNSTAVSDKTRNLLTQESRKYMLYLNTVSSKEEQLELCSNKIIEQLATISNEKIQLYFIYFITANLIEKGKSSVDNSVCLSYSSLLCELSVKDRRFMNMTLAGLMSECPVLQPDLRQSVVGLSIKEEEKYLNEMMNLAAMFAQLFVYDPLAGESVYPLNWAWNWLEKGIEKRKKLESQKNRKCPEYAGILYMFLQIVHEKLTENDRKRFQCIIKEIHSDILSLLEKIPELTTGTIYRLESLIEDLMKTV